MGVRDQNVGHGLMPHRREQRRDVLGMVGTRIDDRHLPAPDDVAARARKGGRPGVAGHHAAHERTDGDTGLRLGRAGQIEDEFVAHREAVSAIALRLKAACPDLKERLRLQRQKGVIAKE